MPTSALRPLALAAITVTSLFAGGAALAQEAAIRKALSERIPSLPKIDEVRATPVAGLFEVRYGGSEIIYTDAKGEYVLSGQMIDTKTMTDLTQARIDKLNAIDFADLPIKDSLVIKQGTGARKMAVFVDPNCGYCKRFERDLASVKDVTIYTFVMPILGPDSVAKSRDIVCAKDPAKTWRAWMLDNVAPTRITAQCDSTALDRNTEFGRKYRIQGTPAVFFEDGTRKPGAIPAEMVEKLLVAASKKG